MNTETTEYLYITDAGHGWLKVPLTELINLGITNKISTYSYRYNGNVYLEHDCDAPMFANAMADNGLEFKPLHVDCSVRGCMVRGYPHYSVLGTFR
jgi:hypothetical protein